MHQLLQKINNLNHRFHASHNVYDYLVFLGKAQNKTVNKLKSYTLITGCQAQVWIHLEIINHILTLEGYSDSLIVSGLINIICEMYQSEHISDLRQLDPLWYQQLFIYQRLSPRRMLGFASTLNFIHKQIIV